MNLRRRYNLFAAIRNMLAYFGPAVDHTTVTPPETKPIDFSIRRRGRMNYAPPQTQCIGFRVLRGAGPGPQRTQVIAERYARRVDDHKRKGGRPLVPNPKIAAYCGLYGEFTK